MRIAALLLLLLSTAAPAAGYRVRSIAAGLEYPWSLATLPDGRLLVTERAGRLRVIENGQLRAEPVTGLPAVFVRGQAGLFDVLRDADFANNRTLYLSFAAGDNAANATRVISARLDGGQLADIKTLFSATPQKKGAAHYGARMAQLADGTLAIGLGDGFAYREEAQNLRSHLGKIVRINRDGSVPTDNPFAGRADALPEIYSYGHRNVQGLHYDAGSNTLYAHEHGPRGGDEINRIQPGRNYGWPLVTYGLDYSGAVISPYTERPGLEAPLLHWTPSIAPAGLALYRGAAFPAWNNSLLVAALAAKHVRRVPLTDSGTGAQEILFAELKRRIRDVRVAADGGVYLLTDEKAGEVLKIEPAP